ncbi:MAG: PAS domain S-box protein, partial [Chloroflexota bacterium]|nr:PAS domain S-box protein [Chloroflexota bacterium]
MPAGVAFLDNDFVLRRCNRAYAALIRTYLSLSPEQALGMSYFDYAPGSREQVEEWFTKVRDSGQSETRYGFKLVLKQDREQVTYWDTSIAPVFSSAGNVEGILILTQDITERKRAEEALQQSEKRFRALVEHATDLVAVIDREGTCRYASPSFEPMLGYAPEELIGKDLFLLVHPDDLPDARRAVAIRVENAGVASNLMQVRLRYSDGSWRVHEGIGNNLLDDPAVQGIVITSRDITERKRAEDELRKKDEHHRNVVESIFRFVPEGLLVFTEDLGLVNQNKAFEEITQQYAVRLGYTEQELAELIAEQVRSRLLSGDAARAEIHIPKKRG